MPKNPTTDYAVENMRLTFPQGKVAEKNPDRFGTVHGEFYAIENGKRSKEPLSYSSKEITKAIAANPLTVIDIANGRLTLPAGERGRKAVAGADQETVDAMLAALRPAPVADADAEVANPEG